MTVPPAARTPPPVVVAVFVEMVLFLTLSVPAVAYRPAPLAAVLSRTGSELMFSVPVPPAPPPPPVSVAALWWSVPPVTVSVPP